MHKWRVVEVFGGQNTSSIQTQKRQKLEDNDFKQIATHDSKKLSWTFFMEHIMAYFDNAFVSKQKTCMEKYK